MRKKLLSATLMCMMAVGAFAADVPAAPVSLSWQLEKNKADVREYRSYFTLTNTGKTTLKDGWTIYFNALPHAMTTDKGSKVQLSEVIPNYYKLTPADNFSLAPGKSVKIYYTGKSSITQLSYCPDGGHFAFNSDSVARPLPIDVKPLEWGRFEPVPVYPTAEKVYAFNEEINPASYTAANPAYEILPGIKSVVTDPSRKVNLNAAFTIEAGNGVETAAHYAELKLGGKQSVGNLPLTLRLMSGAEAEKTEGRDNYEYYEMTIAPEGITIAGLTDEAVTNGVKTLLKLRERNAEAPEVAAAKICDWPDLHYRGMMLDIARNFTTVDNMKKLIDKLASYKINRFHFHFSDDEAWRLEIPGLPELTEVSARRGMTETETDFLCQCYAGNGNPNDLTTTSNGHLTREEFIDLLQYAAARGIQVIPEIESPGHARAAIVAMKSRYQRLKATDPEAAEYYRVWDPDDTSYYSSAQGYHDNVLNPSLEGTYHFIEKVVDEIILMYREAGVTLPCIHMGGDEVPKNPWVKSPEVQKFMAEKGLTSTHEVEEYFITRVAKMIAAKGYKIAGWQEAAMRHSELTDKVLRPLFANVYVWNTVPEWKGDILPYSIANNGYNVVLCNVSNFYVDLAYSAHQDERGLHWGGYVDEFRSWDARPFDNYKSTTTTLKGEPLPANHADTKPALQPEARPRISGVQAQLFSETIRGYDFVEYYVFPKILGLVERGWNAEPLDWQSKAQFNELVGSVELPQMDEEGMNFHLRMPGIKEEKGMLLMNTPYDAAEIRYTTDGSEPTEKSPLWKAPVKAKGKVVKAKLFYLGKESKSTRLDR